ncbi:hypothetical protein [Acinetobacter junii]|uniref:hypothetical protein n=1 Tax=Acinetobacter junii TaxID=40215 RepID=UPI001F1D7DCA|nr:hypothetical protein [Acinetobacter junii]
MKLSVASITFLTLFNSFSYAASSCDTILVHGLRNIEVSSSKNEATSLKYQKNCGSDFHSMSEEMLVQAEVEAFGYGNAGGSFSRGTREEKLKTWCNTNKEVATNSGSTSSSSQTFYQGAVSAWDNCNKLYSRDLKIEPIISPDAKTVAIGISYSGPTTGGVKLFGVEAEGFQCSITTPYNGKKVSFPVNVGNESIQTLCKRSASQIKTRDGTSYEVVPRGTINIQTASYPFQLYFAEEWDPGLPVKEAQKIREAMVKMDIPVGTIISSTLSPDIFLGIKNPQFDSSRWIEANGKELPLNSKYQVMTGSKFAPDLSRFQKSEIILDVVSKQLVTSDTDISTIQTDKGKDGNWVWYASLGDISGNRTNNDYEQDVDNFIVEIKDSNKVSALGRTLNWKHGRWGQWKSGSANLLGVSSIKNPLYYYVKIN